MGYDRLREAFHGKPEVDLHPGEEVTSTLLRRTDLSVEAPNPRKPEGSQGLDTDDHDNARALVKHPHDHQLAAGGHLGPFQLVTTVTPSVAHGAGQLGHRPPA